MGKERETKLGMAQTCLHTGRNIHKQTHIRRHRLIHTQKFTQIDSDTHTYGTFFFNASTIFSYSNYLSIFVFTPYTHDSDKV